MTSWKCGRVVEGIGLENRSGATHRGFESHRFRHLLLSAFSGFPFFYFFLVQGKPLQSRGFEVVKQPV